MNNQYPYTHLVQSSVAWYPPHLDVFNGLGAPKDPTSPNKPWRDNSFLAGGNWWNPAPPATDRVYRVIATDAQGAPLLTPIGSSDFYATYTSLSVVNVYKEYAFMFPAGVPYLVNLTVPARFATSMNFGGTEPGYGYPIALRSDFLLLPPSFGADGTVQCIYYEDFLAQAKPRGLNYDQMIVVVRNVLASGLSSEYMVQQIRLAVQNSPTPDRLI